MYIVGISAYYHDSAAALIHNGRIVAAAQEERFTRRKHDPRFPTHALDYLLQSARIRLEEIDHIVFYDKPLLKFERLLEAYLAFAPRGLQSFKTALPVWLTEKLFLRNILHRELISHLRKPDKATKNQLLDKLLFSEHHLSHAASAFYPSPFDEAIVLTMDGVGEWATTSVAVGRGKVLDIVKEIHFPHSLGLLYSAFTYYLGFKVNSGEYKVMGLAPYGEPTFVEQIWQHLVHVADDASFALNMHYFDYCTGLTMTNRAFAELFGQPPRRAESEITPFHMNVAASVQVVVETIILKLTKSLAEEYGIDNLCLAGGVALNCVANGKIKEQGAFQNIWIQPAAGDAGGAIGAALVGYHLHCRKERKLDPHVPDGMNGAYLGPDFTDGDILRALEERDMVYQYLPDEEALLQATTQALVDDGAVGWFQGRMEFGPRALGGRSILGNPLSEKAQTTLNTKIKFRESFRPFAPSVTIECVSDWFAFNGESPYMLMVAPVAPSKRIAGAEKSIAAVGPGFDRLQVKRSLIPAVTHVDGSARVQTVDRERNPRYHRLIATFGKLTGCPVLVNTSFNIRGEPMVCTPQDAIKCFLGTQMDALVIGNYILYKKDQDTALANRYTHEFTLD